MSVYDGNWTLNEANNGSCTLVQTADDSKIIIWFGSEDGSTPNSNYSHDSFVIETSLSIASGRNAGILFGGVNVSGSEFYYFDVDPAVNLIHLFRCCWTFIFTISQTFDYGEKYNLRISANGEYFSFSVDDVLVRDLQITNFTTGSVGLISHRSTTTFYSLNYTTFTDSPSNVPTLNPTTAPS